MPDCPGEDDLHHVAEFIAAAAATGTVLDAPDDRKLVQGLIDYWVASLQTDFRESSRSVSCRAARVKPATTVLAGFDRGHIPAAVVRADAWLAGLAEADRRIAERVLLRLVRLRTTGRTFDAVPAPRAALTDVAPNPEAVDRLLEGLVEAGVIRRLPGDLPGSEQVALRTAELMTTWPTLAAWLGERLRFRDAATGWAEEKSQAAQRRVSRTVDVFDQWLARTLSKFGRSVDRLVTPAWLGLRRRSGLATPTDRLLGGDALEDARTYHDRNLVEREFTDASRYQQQLAGDRNRVLMGLFGLATIVASVFLVCAVTSAIGWRQQADEAIAQRDEADRQRKEAIKQQKEAEKNLADTGVRRLQAIERQLVVEEREALLASLLDLVLNRPSEAGAMREGPRKEQDRQLLDEISLRSKQVKRLQDPHSPLPLHPGCRVWLVPQQDANGKKLEPSMCSVCCIVRPGDPSDRRRFAVVYCSPEYHRVSVEAHRGTVASPVVLGRLLNPDTLVAPAAPGDSHGQWIALIELSVPANNQIPTHLGGPLRGTDSPVGDTATLLGNCSGLSTITCLSLASAPSIDYVSPKSIIGDGGSPVIDDRRMLVAMHMVSNEENSRGYRIAPWLKAHGLELDLPPSK
jgi:hypothetical protein